MSFGAEPKGIVWGPNQCAEPRSHSEKRVDSWDALKTVTRSCAAVLIGGFYWKEASGLVVLLAPIMYAGLPVSPLLIGRLQNQ